MISIWRQYLLEALLHPAPTEIWLKVSRWRTVSLRLAGTEMSGGEATTKSRDGKRVEVRRSGKFIDAHADIKRSVLGKIKIVDPAGLGYEINWPQCTNCIDQRL